MVTDAERHELQTVLENKLGERPAGILMAMQNPVDWNDIARRSDVEAIRSDLAVMKGDVAVMKVDIAELKTGFLDLRGEFADLRGQFADLRGDVYEIKGGLVALSARVDSQFSRLLAAIVPVMFGLAGLVLAAGKLA